MLVLNKELVNKKIDIRPFGEDDFEIIRRWHVDMCLAELSEDEAKSLDIKSFIQRTDKILIDTAGSDTNSLYVADLDNTIVGFILIGPTKEFFSLKKRMFVYAIYCDPKYRGLGIGRMLMDKAKIVALESGMDEVWLTVTESNDAVEFYKRIGYKTCRRTMILDTCKDGENVI